MDSDRTYLPHIAIRIHLVVLKPLALYIYLGN